MTIYTRFGIPVELIKPIDSEGWVKVLRDGKDEREYHVSELKADGGFNEIEAASKALEPKVETMIEITATQSKSSPYSWWGRNYKYHTNLDCDVSVIDDRGGYEIMVFDDNDEAEKQEWVSTVDEMIRRFSVLVAEYTLNEVQS